MSQPTSTSVVSRTAPASWSSGPRFEVARRAASANRHVKTITGRMLSADAATTTLDGINPSIHRWAAAPAAGAGAETPVETGNPSDANAGRRSRPETTASVNRADTTSNAAKTAGIASPSRPDWLFLPRRAPTARKSCDTIRGSTMARSAFVHARTSTSSPTRRESETGWGYCLARRPPPRPARRVRLRLAPKVPTCVASTSPPFSPPPGNRCSPDRRSGGA